MGEFEEMYRNSAVTSCRQDEQENWIDVRLAKEMILALGQFDGIHDSASGAGHYPDLIAKHGLVTNGGGCGTDVSATGCEKAIGILSSSIFSVLDLTEQGLASDSKRQTANGKQLGRLFIIRGTLWYVFPKVISVVENISN